MMLPGGGNSSKPLQFPSVTGGALGTSCSTACRLRADLVPSLVGESVVAIFAAVLARQLAAYRQAFVERASPGIRGANFGRAVAGDQGQRKGTKSNNS